MRFEYVSFSSLFKKVWKCIYPGGIGIRREPRADSDKTGEVHVNKIRIADHQA